MKKPIWIGLTGGACSGKSTVSTLIQGHGVPVFNLDTIGHELIERDARVVAGLKKICGDTIMDGIHVNRKRVREILFSSPEKKREIEAFLHPLIWNRFLELSKNAEKNGETCIVCESALIIESSLVRQMDEMVIVIAEESERINRLMKRDDISNLLATQMIKSQTDDTTRKSHATFVIENHGTLEELGKKVDKLINVWRDRKWLKR